VDDEEIMRRLASRGRKDDLEKTIRRRLEIYRAETKPVLDWYEQAEVPVLEIGGVGNIDEIQEQILGCLAL
jgi:adenylate kinase